MNSTRTAPLRRRLILHAGTHKTASTDIQSRLLRSTAELKRQNLIYRFPHGGETTFKRLTRAITRDNWDHWRDYLKALGHADGDVLVSAEQFAPRLTRRSTVDRLQAIAAKHGFELIIVIFIRSQLDYINSRYAYTLKRFYHCETFPSYVEQVLQGKLPSSGTFTGPNAKRSDVFDFWNYFTVLRQAKASGLDVRFIPFRQTHADPFMQLLDTLELDPAGAWAASRHDERNKSPGPRGTCLARQLALRLSRHGISHRSIENSSAIIPREEHFRRWQDGSYWGFDAELSRRVQQHFKGNNNLFAKAVWGKSWKKVFIHDRKLQRRPQNTYTPLNVEEQVRMDRIADHLLLRINRRLQDRPLHGLRERVERLASLTI